MVLANPAASSGECFRKISKQMDTDLITKIFSYCFVDPQLCFTGSYHQNIVNGIDLNMTNLFCKSKNLW